MRPASRPSARDRHHLGAVQRHQAVRRAHEVHAGPAVGELVAHDLGDRQLGERLVERLLQARRRASRRARGCRGTAPRPCRRAGACSCGTADASAPSAASFFSSAGVGLAVGVERHATGISLCDTGLVGAPARPRRRRAPPGGAAMAKAVSRGIGCGQALRLAGASDSSRGERLAQLLQRLGRQLLDEQFDQQVLACVMLMPPSSPAAPVTSSAQASRRHREAQPRAAVAGSSARRCAPGCGCGRCRRRAR